MAYVRLPELKLSAVDQRYTRRESGSGGEVYRYQSGTFQADLHVDSDGIVIDYPACGGGSTRSPRPMPAAPRFIPNEGGGAPLETIPTRVTTDTPMIDALRAAGPYPPLRDELMLFGQFVGVWDMHVHLFDESGNTTYDQDAEWAFGWVLDGRAIQDVLTGPNYRTGGTAPGERGIGTSIRTLEPGTSTWRVYFVSAAGKESILLRARQVGDEIWVEGPDTDGSQLRWTFTNIEPDRFHWKGFTSPDRGVTWRMEQEMLATRRTA